MWLVGAEGLANGVCDVAGCGGESTAGLIHASRGGIDPFGDDAPVPVAGEEDLESLVATGGEAEFIRDAPRSGERQPIAAGQTVGLVRIRILVVRGMKPTIGSLNKDPGGISVKT